MSDMHINKPFVTHDGVDPKGIRAEVRVYSGYADVTHSKRAKNKTSPMHQFGFEIDSSEYPTNGWINKEKDEKIFNVLQEAYDNQTPVHFRIEAQRKNDVDRTIPIAELMKDSTSSFDNVFRYIVAVKEEDAEEWIVGTSMVTSFKEDSQGGTFKATDADVGQASNTSLNAPVAAKEAVKDDDGNVNPNSPALLIPLDILNTMNESIFDKEQWKDKINDKIRQSIVLKMMIVAGKVQKEVLSNDNNVDMGENSFNVAVESVKEAIIHRVDFDVIFDSEDELTKENLSAMVSEYANAVYDEATAIAEWSVLCVDKIQR